MLSFGFGKRPKHKKFDYLPRYYNENKENLSQRISQHSGEVSDEDKLKQRISSGLRHKYIGNESYRKATVRKSNLRIVYILVVLCIVSYLILTSDRIQRFLEVMEVG